MSRTSLRDSVKPAMLAAGTKAKIIARNTFQFTAPGGAIVTRLHQTDVVKELGAGRYQLDSGGWRTVTTKDRMNGAMNGALRGYHIYSSKGSWYVVEGSHGWTGGIPYYDGMILPDAFKKPGKGLAAEKKEQATRELIKKFVRSMDKLETLPLPSAGDCWHCSMTVSAPEKDKGKTLGDATGDTSHLMEHIKEGYLHGSLLVNALRWAGYQDIGIQYWLTSKIGQRSQVKSALRRYLYRKLGMVS